MPWLRPEGSLLRVPQRADLPGRDSGQHVVERLKTLYALTHLRGRLHITLRDLRSALAFTLVGTRDCDEIHELYRTGRRDEIVRASTSTAGGRRRAER